MRILVSFALPVVLAACAIAPDEVAPSRTCQVYKLAIVSTDLPQSEQEAIVHAFQGGTYDVQELTERIRSKLRDAGYELAEVQSPQINTQSATSACDLSFSIHAGDVYRLGAITFSGATAFQPAQLRAQFHLQDGEVFNATTIGKGLENLKDLYGSAGYPDFGAIPKPTFDSARHTASLSIDIDEGRLMNFGNLLFDGIEPRSGLAQELLASWKNLQGKRYNAQALKDWLKKNSAGWPNNAGEHAYTQMVASRDPASLNVLLHFE